MNKLKIIFLLIWMIVIFCFSNQKADDSAALSDGVINKTIVKVYEIFNGDISTEKKEEILTKYTYPVRKFAHFTVYFILGILSYIAIHSYINTKDIILYSLLFCFIYACSDEFHQYFVDGRSCSIIDVVIDSVGSLCAILLCRVSNK